MDVFDSSHEYGSFLLVGREVYREFPEAVSQAREHLQYQIDAIIPKEYQNRVHFFDKEMTRSKFKGEDRLTPQLSEDEPVEAIALCWKYKPIRSN